MTASHAEPLRALDAMQQQAADDATERAAGSLPASPLDPVAWRRRGLIAYQAGRNAAAIADIEKAIAIDPNYVDAISDLAAIYREMGDLGKAVGLATLAIQIAPDHVFAHCNLGAALQDLGEDDGALAAFATALRLNPQLLEAQANAIDLLLKLQRYGEAVEACKRMISSHPVAARSYFCAGNLLRELGQTDQALASFRNAVAIQPSLAEAHVNIASILLRREEIEASIAASEEAIKHNPALAIAHYNRGAAYQLVKRHARAIEAYETAYRLDPRNLAAAAQLYHQKRIVCDWTALDAIEAELLDRARRYEKPLPPFPLLSAGTSAADQLRVARLWAKSMRLHPRFTFAERDMSTEDRKLRIGYLSSDFRDHPTSHLTTQLFREHDRQSFTIIGYAHGRPDSGEARANIARSFEEFIDIGALDDRSAADRIFADEIDILVDLNGYTHGARSEILAQRPAPIQVNYLGYPSTMGCDFVDYIIADPVVIQESARCHYAEKVVYLPDCYQPNADCSYTVDRVPTRTACKLPDDAFVFCCFNSSYKLTPAFFDVWMRLLAAVPGSVLWLIEDNSEACANLAAAAAAHNIDPARLVFAPRVAHADHLTRQALGDLFLDCGPYTAHTTASDALRMGLPVVTIMGETFAGRVTASLLHTLGLDEMIVASLHDYEALASRLASTPRLLQNLRAKLETNKVTHPLFKPQLYAQHLESAYRTMWQVLACGEAPRHFSVMPIQDNSIQG